APDKARFVGEGVAMVVAETLAAAKEAADLVDVDYETLPAITVTRDAVEPTAPRVWEDHGSNICVDAEVGNREATDAAFARAAHVVKLKTWIQRVTGVPMEPRSALGSYDAAT